MSLYIKTDKYELHQGMMQSVLQEFEDNSIDSIVCDPPYELGFMNKTWDSTGVAFNKSTWGHCLRVLKPGGYLLAFGGSRTFHRIACAIEDAGFDIRDTIMWLYGSGFPKSMNIGLAIDKKNGIESKVVAVGKSGATSKGFNDYQYRIDKNIYSTSGEYEIKQATNEWNGWGSCLKPAFEPIIVARKPFECSLVDNVIEYGVGGLNIDECRVGDELIGGGTAPNLRDVGKKQKEISGIDKLSFGQVSGAERIPYEEHIGRFPANVILTYDDTDKQEVCGGFPDSGRSNGVPQPYIYAGREYHNSNTSMFNGDKPQSPSNYNDSGSASRYYYCAKASRKDRDEGCEKNNHPTVKPTELIQYLVRLVTPRGGKVLDCFMGSGSTGKACMYENIERDARYYFIGIELDTEYTKLSNDRIKYALADNDIDGASGCFVTEPVKEDNLVKVGLF